MGEMASLWGYAEHRDMDQLGQKLLYTTLELEKLKSEAVEEMRKNKEYVNQLINLLKCAIQERDEARNQLQKLITTTTTISPTKTEIFPAIPHFQADSSSPLLKPAKANSSITESNSFSETHNYHSHGGGSSPVDSLFDAVSSPEFSNMSFVNHGHFVQDSAASLANATSNFIAMPKLDRGSLIVENLAKGRVLPQKGMLLQSVLQAGPLLQTLMVAGPLPRWRNPPQMQPFQIPPVAIKSGNAEVLAQKPASNVGQLGSGHLSSSQYMSDFGNVNLSGTNCLNNASSLISSAVTSNGCFRLPKRQRFC
ncbi:hypothetical protein C2S51_023595 [Perilla frutescens var. frutescens]|nr:hypothetical protein C2S51_023595 [Perilla frutescens var. frutescens]